MPVLKVRVDNCWIDLSGSSEDVEVSGFATEQWVKDTFQPKGEYLTEVPEGYAKTEDIPTAEYINNIIDDKLSQIASAEGESF